MKLFVVEIQQGVQFYVVAGDPTTAYEMVRQDLDKRDYYFFKSRAMKTVRLVADSDQYGDVDRLYLQSEAPR